MAESPTDGMRDKLLGFGEASVHKSYYPQLRKRLEELELFHALLDHASDMIFLVDSETLKVQSANLAACGLLGCTRQNVADKGFMELFDTVCVHDHVGVFDQSVLVQGGTFEVSLKGADGVRRFFELTVSSMTIGARRHSVGVARDISQRKAYQDALRESEERFRAIFNAISDLIFVHHVPTGTILEVNQRACDTFGYTCEEFKRLDVGTLSCAERGYDQNGAMQLMRQAMDGKPQVAQWCVKTKAGRRFWLEVSIRCAFIGDKKRVLVSGRDISARKAAEEELKQARATIQDILDSMPSLVVGVDASLTVTYWNLAAKVFTGLSADQARGRHLALALPCLANNLDAVSQALATGAAVRRQNLLLETGGQQRHEELQVYPLMGAAGVTGAVVRLDDVTERIRMQETLLQAEKMMSVGGLAAGMAHEINNPLAGILQNVQNMERRLYGALPANETAATQCGSTMEAFRCYMEERGIGELMRNVKQSGERAARIVSNMLSFSRPGSSAHLPVKLDELADRVVEIASSNYDLKKKYDFRRIQIDRRYQADMPPAPCSRSEIEQVLLNLLQNAAQALATDAANAQPRIAIRIYQEEEQAVVEVEDNGPGMDENLRRRIFEPFVTTKAPGEGTGLGLSVSYFIVTRNHGGSIQVFSEPGAGARFVVSLPLRPGASKPA